MPALLSPSPSPSFSFQAAGADAIVRPAADKLGDIVSALDFIPAAYHGEFAERGIYSTARSSRFTSCRADHNWGHGFCGTGMFANCLAFNNSQGADETYDAFVAIGQGGRWFGCQAIVQQNLAGDVPRHRYGFNGSGSEFATPTNRHLARGFSSLGHATAAILQPAVGAIPHHIDALGVQLHGVITATPSVEGVRTLVPTNGGGAAVTVTNFLGGHLGQIVEVGGNANVTYTHGTNFFTTTGANKVILASRVAVFKFMNIGAGNFWYELGAET